MTNKGDVSLNGTSKEFLKDFGQFRDTVLAHIAISDQVELAQNDKISGFANEINTRFNEQRDDIKSQNDTIKALMIVMFTLMTVIVGGVIALIAT